MTENVKIETIKEIRFEKKLIEISGVLAFCLLILIFIIIFPRIPFLNILELKFLDLRYLIRQKIDPPRTPPDDIVLLVIDDESYYTLNRPLVLWNEFYTPIIYALRKGKARVIGIDSLQMISTEKYIPGGDTNFANAIRDGDVVMISAFARLVNLKKNREEAKLINPPEAISDVLNPLEDIGVASLDPDMDGYIRTQTPYFTDEENRFRYAFSFLIAKKFLGKPIELDNDFQHISIGKDPIPLDDEGRMLINYVGPAGSFKMVPFIEAYKKAKSGDEDFFRKHFQGKAVIISSVGGFSSDYHRTPFNGMGDPKRMPGIEVQANILNTLLEKQFLRPVSPFVNYLLIYLLIVIAALISYSTRSFQAIALFAVLLSGYFIISVSLFVYSGLVFKIAYPVFGMLVSYMGVGLWNYIYKERERKKVQETFGRYVSPEVMDEILYRPGAMELGGSRREVTILFSDINKFTNMSEKMEPEEVISLLNEYYSYMVEIVNKHNGTLKQFVGDELMVIFNAPVPMDNHQSKAVECVLDMKEFLDKWNEERVKSGKRQVGVKFGIHTGDVVVGNIGSKDRMEYSTIGDVVNTASRIMNLNKELNTKSGILISAEVYEAVKENVCPVKEYKAKVRGKEKKIYVYEIDKLLIKE